MNFKSFAIFAVAASFVACTSKTSTITCHVDPELVNEVQIKINDKDTLLAVENGVVSYNAPTDIYSVVRIRTPFSAARVIADGSSIDVDFTKTRPLITSSKKDICAKMVEYDDSSWAFQNRYSSLYYEIQADSTLTEEQKAVKFEEEGDAIYEEYQNMSLDVIEANKDNIISAVVLSGIYSGLEADKTIEIISGLSEQIQQQKTVAGIASSIESRLATSEGKMFTDFEVVVDPETGKKEKLSDYVGKGKYVLVDFWASWCGPCKQEIPNLKQVYEKHHGENFDILSVAVWDEPQKSIDTAAVYNIPWNHMVNTQYVATEIYGIQGIPHIILFGPDGTIIKRDLRGEEIERTVSQHVK